MRMAVKKLNKELGRQLGIEEFGNFSVTGNITGMKNLYYGKDALLIRCGSFIYHVGNMRNVDMNNLRLGEALYFTYAE